ncbi:MAG: hypothetical protein R3E01_23870 [Pirellulaceae bacterium]
MSVLLDSPWMVGIGGLALSTMLFGGLIKTGDRRILWGIVGVVALTVVMLLIERMVVTSREEIAATIRLIAVDLESNDVDRVAAHISATAPELNRKDPSANKLPKC